MSVGAFVSITRVSLSERSTVSWGFGSLEKFERRWRFARSKADQEVCSALGSELAFGVEGF